MDSINDDYAWYVTSEGDAISDGWLGMSYVTNSYGRTISPDFVHAL